MEHHGQYSLLRFVSRITIIIPIIIIVVGIVFYSPGNVANIKNSGTIPLISPTTAITPTSTVLAIKLDLVGPFSCSYNEKSASISAFIKNKKIKVVKTETGSTKHYILSGDCLYQWSGTKTGTKMCGVGQYLSLVETLSSFGMLDIGRIITMVSQFGIKSDQLKEVSQEDLTQKIIQNCKKDEVVDSIFTIPLGVSFNETKLVTPSP